MDVAVPPDTLDTDERLRAARFHFERDRQAFTAARRGMRAILAGYLSIPPADVSFVYGPHGKPALQDAAVSFNLSHSRDLALLAVVRDRDVGIDVEFMRDNVEFEALARRFFTPAEGRAVAAPDVARAFFRIWTRKESVMKALGRGLSLSPETFEVVPTEAPRVIHLEGDMTAARRWSMADVDVPPQYAAAITVEGHGWKLCEKGDR